jgi:TPR repeat protein
MTYLTGSGVPADSARAVTLLEEAARQEDLRAQYAFGMARFSGQDTTRDLEAARGWFARAAEQGHQHAQYMLALMLHDGQGGQRNTMAAGRWYDRASRGRDRQLAEAARRLRDQIQESANSGSGRGPGDILLGLGALFLAVTAAAAIKSGGDGASDQGYANDREERCRALSPHCYGEEMVGARSYISCMAAQGCS